MTAVAVIKNLNAVLDADVARKQILPLLPKGVDLDAVIADANYAARQNAEILECTPYSIIDAVARIQQWDLRIGLTAHLVPFNTKISKRNEPDRWAKICTPVADYKGLAELMVRSGAVRVVEPRVVYAGDTFTYRYGLNAMLEHQPTSKAKERGVITHAYVILRLPFGHSSFEVMTADDIDEIRRTYSKKWKDGALKAWYAKKTVIRQSAKLIPKDPRLAAVLNVIREDEDSELETPGVLPPGSARALPAGRGDEEYAPEPATDPDDPRFFDHLPEDDA